MAIGGNARRANPIFTLLSPFFHPSQFHPSFTLPDFHPSRPLQRFAYGERVGLFRAPYCSHVRDNVFLSLKIPSPVFSTQHTCLPIILSSPKQSCHIGRHAAGLVRSHIDDRKGCLELGCKRVAFFQ